MMYKIMAYKDGVWEQIYECLLESEAFNWIDYYKSSFPLYTKFRAVKE